jgi:hypothetical protein
MAGVRDSRATFFNDGRMKRRNPMMMTAFFVGAILEGLKRKKCQKKFCGLLPGRHNIPRDILGPQLLLS